LSVAAATSWAQVYSVNAVGYVNLSLRSDPGGPLYGTIVANPLNGTNNELNTIMPLGDAYGGSTIYRFDPALQNYQDAIIYYGAEAGWFTPSGSTVVNPGESFWMYPQGPNPCNITFVGEVPQGQLSNPLPGPNKLSMRSSIVPQTARLGDPTMANSLLFAADDSDTVYIFDPTVQNYKDAYIYYGVRAGWFSPSDPDPAGPEIPVGTGFFIQKGPTATKTSWDRTFSVN
jgi:hypothetical protein